MLSVLSGFIRPVKYKKNSVVKNNFLYSGFPPHDSTEIALVTVSDER